MDGRIYFHQQESGFVKRFASLATAFPPMILRSHRPASSILSDLIRVPMASDRVVHSRSTFGCRLKRPPEFYKSGNTAVAEKRYESRPVYAL